jgi:hypothetical protein
MAIPTFDGNALFGYDVQMITSSGEPSIQRTAYPGVSGQELLYLGSRGRFTQATGILKGSTPAAVAILEGVIRDYRESGIVATLTTTQGETFPNCVIWDYKPQPPLLATSDGVCERRYQVVIFHLI